MFKAYEHFPLFRPSPLKNCLAPVASSHIHYRTKRQATATFDALGRMLTSVGGMSQSTSFTYDDNGNVLTVTDPLTNVTTMTYDDLNRVLTVTDAATNETEYTYDLLGRVLTVTDPRGKVSS